MKLRTRLIIAFFTIILMPLGLAGATVCVMANYQVKALERDYGMEGASYEHLSNPMPLLNQLTKNTFRKLERQKEKSSAKFQDEEYLDSLNRDLEDKNSYVVVSIDGEVYYSGTQVSAADTLESILEIEEEGDTTSNNSFYLGDKEVMVKWIAFETEDNLHGRIYIVTNVKMLIPQIKEFGTNLILAIVFILFITSAGLTLWIYCGIMRPLKKLQLAAQNIRDGNLDFRMDVNGKNEIEDLCQDFEAMRKRLKVSAEEKLEQDRDSKELISNISHDLKTPITAVKGYVEGIMDGVADTPEKMDKYIRTIYNKANEMDLLINELTLYSKIDTNRIPYAFHKIKVREYFGECAAELSLELESKNLEFSYTNYVDEDIEIIADTEQLRRAIHNIVGNSAKYMDKEKGFIHIRIKDVGSDIQVEIEDNGKGIASKDLPYIFERFYRTDASRNSAQGGSGIGLSIVRKIVEEHGGKIWATSKESVGTIMYFVLRKYEEVVIDE